MTNQEDTTDDLINEIKGTNWKKIITKLVDVLFIFGCGFAFCYYGFQVDNIALCNEFIYDNYGIQTYNNGSSFVQNYTPMRLLINGTIESIEPVSLGVP